MRKFLADSISVVARRLRRPGRSTQDWGADRPHAERIRAAYRCLLRREADPAGQSHWLAFLRNRGSLQDMLASFIRSPEFTARLNEPPPSQAQVSTSPAVVAPKRNKFAVIGNCQSAAMMRCLQALTGFEMPTLHWRHPDLLLKSEAERARVVELFGRHEKVFVQPAYWNVLSKQHPEFEDRVVLFPSVGFMAYHPDLVYIHHKASGEHIFGPCRDYQSSIAFLGWKAGLSAGQTFELFNSDRFSELGFFDTWQPSVTALLEEGKAAGIELGELLDSWRRRGNFMRAMNHPKRFVSLDIARAVLEKQGIRTARFDVEPYIYDWQSTGAVWPVYPEIGEMFGIGGHYVFKLESPGLQADKPLESMNLLEYVDESFRVFSRYGTQELHCDRLQSRRYQQVLTELLAAAADRVVPVKRAAGPTRAAVPVQYRFAVLGNCQAGGMVRCLQALLGGPMPLEEYATAELLADWESARSSLVPLFSAHDKIFMQPWIWNALAPHYARFEKKVVLYPSIAFMAYHPDLVDIRIRGSGTVLAEGPMGTCHSSLAFLGWTAGLSVAETTELFSADVLRRLGHLDYWRSSEFALLEEGRAAGLPLEAALARWKARGCFMHQPVHPKLFVIADIARMLLERLGIPSLPVELADFAHDHFGDDVAWPVYPGLDEVLGCPGSYEFKQPLRGAIDFSEVRLLGLKELVEESFAVYARYRPDELVCRRLASPGYVDVSMQLQNSRMLPAHNLPQGRGEIAGTASSNQPASHNSHPYSGLPAHRFWRKAVQDVRPAEVDPVVSTKFRIGPDTRIATAGSCLAQHISGRLRARGFNFLQAEPIPADRQAANAADPGESAFSARFGSVYTARQLLQLMERAYGRFAPVDKAWQTDTGRFVDPFRPSVAPAGFVSLELLERSRADHLAAVRSMFETLDVFVFTLALTEAWRARCDGAVFPVAPGVPGGVMDSSRYEFVTFTAAEVEADLQAFLLELQQINPRARLILTVSPVPLVATYRKRHVLVSTTYSKSVLRVAADQTALGNACCDYFPSFEIISGSFSRGSYFADDLRSVGSAGLEHVMQLFFAHYAGDGATSRLENGASGEFEAELFAEARKNIRTVCDEDLLAAAAVR